VFVNTAIAYTSTFNLNGGKISGTGTSCVSFNAADATSNAIFNMTGGEIAAGTGIGVDVKTGGKFTLSGGAITSSNVLGQVYVDDNARSSITLKETGSISTLTYANRALPIYVASGWTGKVENLNLYYNSATANVVNYWLDQQAVLGVSPYALTTEDTAKFENCSFMADDNSKYGFRENGFWGRHVLTKPGNIGKVMKE
jgi:hypothetical protein